MMPLLMSSLQEHSAADPTCTNAQTCARMCAPRAYAHRALLFRSVDGNGPRGRHVGRQGPKEREAGKMASIHPRRYRPHQFCEFSLRVGRKKNSLRARSRPPTCAKAKPPEACDSGPAVASVSGRSVKIGLRLVGQCVAGVEANLWHRETVQPFNPTIGLPSRIVRAPDLEPVRMPLLRRAASSACKSSCTAGTWHGILHKAAARHGMPRRTLA